MEEYQNELVSVSEYNNKTVDAYLQVARDLILFLTDASNFEQQIDIEE